MSQKIIYLLCWLVRNVLGHTDRSSLIICNLFLDRPTRTFFPVKGAWSLFWVFLSLAMFWHLIIIAHSRRRKLIIDRNNVKGSNFYISYKNPFLFKFRWKTALFWRALIINWAIMPFLRGHPLTFILALYFPAQIPTH